MKVNTNTSVSAQSNYVATGATSKQSETKITSQSSEVPKETTLGPEREATQGPDKEATAEERAKVEEFVNKVNKQLERSDTKLQFKVHESKYSSNNKVSIEVIDESNNRVIAEIPSEESIKFAEKMHEIAGVLFDKKN